VQEETVMRMAAIATGVLQEILQLKEAELVQALRARNGVVIEKGADDMDELKYAPRRDLASGRVDSDSSLLPDVKAALRRIRTGRYGTCMDCDEAISPKRLAAVPWAPRCLECQTVIDRNGGERAEGPKAFLRQRLEGPKRAAAAQPEEYWVDTLPHDGRPFQLSGRASTRVEGARAGHARR
jgi:DnaK suppressor protein